MENTQTTEPQETSELETQIYYFSFFKKAPKVFAILIFVLCIAGGIACAILIGSFIPVLISAIAGGIISVLVYLILRLTYAHKLLEIFYLQKISGSENRVLTYRYL